ncbi:Pyruvate kinase I [Stieleria bergensis]|uniref:Pyruvate kinase n=1 Tax=Stieleria bergensis TaxID=2528025 RepID=A0A517SNJ2_9BACT|nr:Pyruvate kinase I [Planctomycetes bacterium SV_7m_r]
MNAVQSYRHTKIIATIGPATDSPEKLQAMISAGVDMIRLNMAHGTVQWVEEIIAKIRAASAVVHREVAVMMDVKGPEVRTGVVAEDIELQIGDRLELHSAAIDPDAGNVIQPGSYRVSVNYPDLPHDLEVGAKVLIDSGLLHSTVIEKSDRMVSVQIETPGTLTSRRHINLPGTLIKLPALTKKDEADLLAGIKAGLDFVALSFVRQAADVVTLRDFLKSHGSEARIISKIEDHAGVVNMHSIIHETDAVMVARGDLGIEIAFQNLPIVQSKLIEACMQQGKPVIVATHLLESMISSPMPTRAEISDVSNAVREQADAIMLSGETTVGAYPLESIDVLKKIIESIEPSVGSQVNESIHLYTPKAKMLRSSVSLAAELGNSAVVVFTRSGFLAYVLGALRAYKVPILAFTDIPTTFHQLLLPWGVEPFLMDFSDDPEETIQNALQLLRERGFVDPESWLVVITNALADGQIIDSLQLRQAGA